MERLRAKEYLTILLDEGPVDERIREEILESVTKADWQLQERRQKSRKQTRIRKGGAVA